MGMRLVALLWVLAACPATSTAPVTTAVPLTTAGSAAPPTAAPPAATPSGGAGSAAPAPAPPPAPASNMTLAEAGVEATSLDRSVDPCVDFYQFACGGWLKDNPIPADRASWGRFGELHEKNVLALTAILEEAAKKPGDKLGDYYTSCMDEAAIEKAGTAPIKALLARAQGVKDGRTWAAAVTELHKAGIWVVWTSYGEASLDDATKTVTWLDGAGLGLPDRDYYDKPEHAATLAGYKEHVQRMLALAGVTKPDAAADVLAIETAIAKVTKTAVEKRDPTLMNNPFDLKGLAKQAKSVDWKAYFKAFGVTPTAKILVGSPKVFAAIDGLRKDIKPAQWASYFTYHLLVNVAFALPKAFDDEAFALQRLVRGVPDKLLRGKRCIGDIGGSLGELLGKAYVDKHFPAEAKQYARTLFDAVVAAMREDIEQLDWMGAATKKVAQDKLAKIVPMVGYPDRWRSYDAVVVKRDDFAGNWLRARSAETKRVLAKSGKPYDRGEWYANTYDIDAYYNPSANNTALIAGILQGPFFGAQRSIAANLGGIGFVIGHELTHGFDDQGAKFDAQGNLNNWWAADDKAKFEAKGKCVADQYGSFEVLPKQFINGSLTLGENIADLGGVKMAYRAYRALRKDAAQPIIADGFTEDQVFFLATAQVWCNRDRPTEAQRRLTADPHSPPTFRVYGSLRNLPELAQAFSCKVGTPMHPEKTCSVW